MNQCFFLDRLYEALSMYEKMPSGQGTAEVGLIRLLPLLDQRLGPQAPNPALGQFPRPTGCVLGCSANPSSAASWHRWPPNRASAPKGNCGMETQRDPRRFRKVWPRSRPGVLVQRHRWRSWVLPETTRAVLIFRTTRMLPLLSTASDSGDVCISEDGRFSPGKQCLREFIMR